MVGVLVNAIEPVTHGWKRNTQRIERKHLTLRTRIKTTDCKKQFVF